MVAKNEPKELTPAEDLESPLDAEELSQLPEKQQTAEEKAWNFLYGGQE